jgi:hypothetical protein
LAVLPPFERFTCWRRLTSIEAAAPGSPSVFIRGSGFEDAEESKPEDCGGTEHKRGFPTCKIRSVLEKLINRLIPGFS